MILWQLDASSLATDANGANLYGFVGRRWSGSPPPPSNPNYSDMRIVGGGPFGEDSVRFNINTTTNQVYIGGHSSIPAVTRPASRFWMGWWKIDYNDLAGIHTLKHILIADNGVNNRPIMTVGTHLAEPNPLTVDLQRDGGVGIITSGGQPRNTWIPYQFEVNTGTSGGSNGYYKLWVGSFTYASPIGTQSGVNFLDVEVANWTDAGWGFFLNDTNVATNNYFIEIARCRITDTFDAAWLTGGGGGGATPAAPEYGRARPYRRRSRIVDLGAWQSERVARPTFNDVQRLGGAA